MLLKELDGEHGALWDDSQIALSWDECVDKMNHVIIGV
jgi:hypothetical protein